MTKEKNKYTPYVLVTLAYVLATMFILQGEETNIYIRYIIIYFWVLSMFITFLFVKLNKL